MRIDSFEILHQFSHIFSFEQLRTGVHFCLAIEAIAPGTIEKKRFNPKPKHYLEEHVCIHDTSHSNFYGTFFSN